MQSMLSVTINGDRIDGKDGQDIFQNALFRLIEICGEKQVIDADKENTCISTTKEGLKYGPREVYNPKNERWYYVSYNHGNGSMGKLGKADFLERLAERLPDVSLKVKVMRL